MTDVFDPESQPEPPTPPPATPTRSLMDGLGARAVRRMTPRVGITLAAAGGFIATGGAIGIGGDQLTTDDGELQRIPGVIVSLAIIGIGLAVLTRIRTGALATAASIGVAVGIPTLIVFATVNDDDFPFFAFDALLLISTVAWLVVHVIGPARGRMIFLALALVFAPIFVMEQVEEISSVPETIIEGFSEMFGAGMDSNVSFDEEGNPVFPEDFDEREFEERFADDLPDPTNLGLIALVFGLVYVLASHVLTRRGYHGTATPLGAVGAVSSLFGVAFLADDLKETGSGVVLVVLGLVVAVVGAVGARRFTTWFGGFLVAEGVLVLVAEALGDDASALTASVVFLLIGLAVVFFGHLAGAALREPDEEDERRSLDARREPAVDPDPEGLDEVDA